MAGGQFHAHGRARPLRQQHDRHAADRVVHDAACAQRLRRVGARDARGLHADDRLLRRQALVERSGEREARPLGWRLGRVGGAYLPAFAAALSSSSELCTILKPTVDP